MKKITADDPESQSIDLVARNLDNLKALLPEAFTEGKVDFDVLRQLLGDAVDGEKERYGLNWHGKRAARQLALNPSRGTLRPCPEESVDWDTTQNLMIEGDNLEVLKLLQKSYADRVKLIYIDPPYNTGKDFVYKDNFRDSLRNYQEITGQIDGNGDRLTSNKEASGRFHTDWLNMMYPRLKLGRDMLRHDGVIFVSISDHEVQNLRQIMDELFGPENFIATVIWQKVFSPKNSARHFSEDHDYIVVYAKNADEWTPQPLPRSAEQNARYKNPDNDPRGPWTSGDLSARNYYSEGTYGLRTPSGRAISGPPPGTYWRISKKRLENLDRDNRIWWGPEGDGVPRLKRFLSEVKDGRVPQTFWPYSEVGHNQDAKKELLELVKFDSSDSVFGTPKPTSLVRRILSLATVAESNDLVMDFFAGSGTTGDAVFQANANDGGNRRFILVQLPELTGYSDHHDIAEVTRARLAAASEKHGRNDRSGKFGFKVLKLDESNVKPWNLRAEDLEAELLSAVDHILPGRGELDLFYEVMLKRGLDLCTPVETRDIEGKTVYSSGGGALFGCFAAVITAGEQAALARGIIEWRKEISPVSDSAIVFRDDAFHDDNNAKLNLAEALRHDGFTTVESL